MNAEKADEIFDYRGLSAYLKMAAGTLRHWVCTGKLPHYKVGSRVVFSRAQIDRWLLTQERNGSEKRESGTEKGLAPLPFEGGV